LLEQIFFEFSRQYFARQFLKIKLIIGNLGFIFTEISEHDSFKFPKQ